MRHKGAPPRPDMPSFSVSVSHPPLPSSAAGGGGGDKKFAPPPLSPSPSSPLRNSDMPYVVMVIQSVIIFITLAAFILYVFSPRGPPPFNPTSAPTFTVTFETAEPGFAPPSVPAEIGENEGKRQQQPPPPGPASFSSYAPQKELQELQELQQPSSQHQLLLQQDGLFKRAAVVSDHSACSEIGRSILTKGGNAVDAAIATMLCVGVTNPYASGIGGGFFMQVYQRAKGLCTTINARETAPQGVDVGAYQRHPEHTAYGWKSIAVPGEIKGFWRAYTDFGSGRVRWAELIEPTVRLCREGIPVSERLARILADDKDKVSRNNELRVMLTNPATNVLYKEGETMLRPALAKTLQRLAEAEDPTVLFYRGEMAATIVKEVQENGGFISLDDLDDYEPTVKDGVTSPLTPSLTQCGPPPPSSWLVTQLIVRVMEELYPPPRRSRDLSSPLFHHRLVEAEKFAYALRTHLGDPYYQHGRMTEMVRNLTDSFTAKMIAAKIRDDRPLKQEEYAADGVVKGDQGASHVAVLDEHGNAVSAASSLNQRFGAKVASSLGIIWNDQMDAFSLPGQRAGSAANSMEAGKTPMSSMSPAIVYDNESNQVRLVIGATGGSKIIQSTAFILVRSLLFEQPLQEAIDAPRAFHLMVSPYAQFEQDFPKEIVESLRARGHEMRAEQSSAAHSATHAIQVDERNGFIYAHSDKQSRAHTQPDGY